MIRKAEIKDIATVTALALKLWNNHSYNDLKREMSEIILNKNSIIVLNLENDIAVGFAQCSLRHDYVEGTKSCPVGYLEGIYIEPPYRKQGNAKKMLAFCESWAKDNHCTEFASDCEINNIESYKFHLAVGFFETNRVICFKKEIEGNDK